MNLFGYFRRHIEKQLISVQSRHKLIFGLRRFIIKIFILTHAIKILKCLAQAK